MQILSPTCFSNLKNMLADTLQNCCFFQFWLFSSFLLWHCPVDFAKFYVYYLNYISYYLYICYLYILFVCYYYIFSYRLNYKCVDLNHFDYIFQILYYRWCAENLKAAVIIKFHSLFYYYSILNRFLTYSSVSPFK